MDRLPEEIILHILSFLDPLGVASVQSVCRRMLSLGRDTELWKTTCFLNSQHEALRRRDQALSDQEARLAILRNAINQSLSSDSVAVTQADAAASSARSKLNLETEARRQQTFANWDPTYPTEDIDFYEEYIHRHAPVSLRYFQSAKDGGSGSEQYRECLGIGAITDSVYGDVQKLLAPLDDGSICLWDAAIQSPTRGRIVARSPPGLLHGSSRTGGTHQQRLTAETGAVENVSVDSKQQKAFVANETHLHEIDLMTLEVVRRQPFPFPITALSEARNSTPLTVGTNMTLHLYDTRVNRPQLGVPLSSRCELIAGSPLARDRPTVDVSSMHVPLSQPGPLSILHLPSSSALEDPCHSIWVAGRFTSLLHYDRRFWPQIAGTLFSGARLSSLSASPHAYVNPRPRFSLSNPSHMRNTKFSPGSTIIAAGEYKGKGSLELYGIPQEGPHELDRSASDGSESQTPSNQQQFHHNRQYASKSRLLSVAPHGARIVFSDGDGVLKWVERDAWSLVRSININDAQSNDTEFASNTLSALPSRPSHSIFAAQPSDDPNSDIVQKILPLSPSASGEVNTNDLAIWTGDGKLGLVGFGRKALQPFGKDAIADDISLGDQWRGEDERERERDYAERMREALERQADEARFVSGLGFGF